MNINEIFVDIGTYIVFTLFIICIIISFVVMGFFCFNCLYQIYAEQCSNCPYDNIYRKYCEDICNRCRRRKRRRSYIEYEVVEESPPLPIKNYSLNQFPI